MIPIAKSKDTIVFILIPSLQNIYVNMLKIIIPDTKDKNLPGQNNPSNPRTANLVASINKYVIGTPQRINKSLYFLAHGHMIGPLTCIQTIACPNMNNIRE